MLISRIAYLILKEKIRPDKILAVTFTKKAADEMKTRLASLMRRSNLKSSSSAYGAPLSTKDIGRDGGKKRLLIPSGVTCTTLHSFCARVLQDYDTMGPDFTIYDDKDSAVIVKALLKEKKMVRNPPLVHPVTRALSTIKSQMLKSIGCRFDNEVYEIANDILHDYNQILRDNNAKDFDDLILDTLKIMIRDDSSARAIRDQFHHILCDEWQDVNKSQYCLLTLLTDNSKRLLHFGSDIDNFRNLHKLFDVKSKLKDNSSNKPSTNLNVDIVPSPRTLFIVGDAFQTIYSWRGADTKNMDYFTTDFPG